MVEPNEFERPDRAAELEQTAVHCCVDVQPGDVVMVRTGRGSTWPDPVAYLPREPGPNLEGARWLAERGAAMSDAALRIRGATGGPVRPIAFPLRA